MSRSARSFKATSTPVTHCLIIANNSPAPIGTYLLLLLASISSSRNLTDRLYFPSSFQETLKKPRTPLAAASRLIAHLSQLTHPSSSHAAASSQAASSTQRYLTVTPLPQVSTTSFTTHQPQTSAPSSATRVLS